MKEKAVATNWGCEMPVKSLQGAASWRDRAKGFVEANLPVLASEVLCWRRTGFLRGAKLRELADQCAAFTTDDDTLRTAEYLVQVAALARVAATPSGASS